MDKKHQAIQVELTVSAWQSGAAQLAELTKLSEEQISDAASKGGLWRKKQGMHKLRRLRSLGSAIEQDDEAGADENSSENSAPEDVAKTEIEPGDQLYLNFDASVLAQVPLVPTLVSDQLNYSIWNKPAGMLSQGSKWSDHCTITQTVSQLHGKPAFLVHRLDKAASGLMVLAHTKNALKKLTALFATRDVEKHYSIEVHGQFDKPLPFVIDTPVEGKSAVSEILQASNDKSSETSALLVSILTGRKHQIRNHLQGIGLPVVGDRLFDKQREHTKDLQLSATRLAFVCPFTNQKREFEL